ncbi:MAG: hypothetical protein ACLPLR_10755 [Terriglobales bacterium]
MKYTPRKRYLVEFSLVMLAYAVVLVISMLLLRTPRPATLRYPLALAPVVPLLFLPFVVLRFFRAMDELQQRIHLEALAFAFASSAVVTFAYGLLQGEGLRPLKWIWVYPIMCVLWVIGLFTARRRYR